eukprot:Sspe_Gene.16107::Locus_5665_Transcript_1_1_Confidence_1.000_Length_1263::g.16107::m.16107
MGSVVTKQREDLQCGGDGMELWEGPRATSWEPRLYAGRGVNTHAEASAAWSQRVARASPSRGITTPPPFGRGRGRGRGSPHRALNSVPLTDPVFIGSPSPAAPPRSPSLAAPPRSPSTPAQDNVTVVQSPDILTVSGVGGESLGMTFRAQVLRGVADGSPAARCGAAEFIGRELTHINGEPVQSFPDNATLTASPDVPLVSLRFSPPIKDPNDGPLPPSYAYSSLRNEQSDDQHARKYRVESTQPSSGSVVATMGENFLGAPTPTRRSPSSDRISAAVPHEDATPSPVPPPSFPTTRDIPSPIRGPSLADEPVEDTPPPQPSPERDPRNQLRL